MLADTIVPYRHTAVIESLLEFIDVRASGHATSIDGVFILYYLIL